MVETTALYNKGEKTGAIDDDAIMVGVPYGWRLIEAPPLTSKQGYSLIFWEPSSVEDCTPAFEKVVSYTIIPPTIHHVFPGWCLYPWGKVHEPHIW
jgi:hypothetical protein